MPDRKWTCPSCPATTVQPHFVTAVGHECPVRPPSRKVSTFRLVRSA